MKSETFSATHRATMQPPNLQQNMESSVWSRAPPVNRAPQPAPGKVQYNRNFKTNIMVDGVFTLPDTDQKLACIELLRDRER